MRNDNLDESLFDYIRHLEVLMSIKNDIFQLILHNKMSFFCNIKRFK